MPIQFRKITECHRVTWGCKTLISANSLHALLLLWSGKRQVN